MKQTKNHPPKTSLFTPKMKLSDMVTINPTLLLIMTRFGIRLGFGEQSIQEVCNQYGLDTEFVLMIFNLYTFNDYLPDYESYSPTTLQHLIPYLKASHHYYLHERLPHIERHLTNIAASAGDRYGTVLRQFFEDYQHEIQDHFAFEEEHIFPLLQQDQGSENPEIDLTGTHFSDNHSDLVDKLSDLTQIIYKYIPADSPEELNELLFGIMQLSSDLEKHATLEEKILIPYLTKRQT